MRRLVLVHRLGVSGRYFDPLVRELVDFDCVVPDLRRHTTIEAQAEALAGFLGGRSAVLGNSLGCQVIADLGVQAPELVERAIFVGPTVDRRHRSAWSQALALLRDSVRERPSLIPIVVSDYLRSGPLRMARTARSALADALERKLPAFSAPLLVVRGERDPLCPPGWGEEVARLAGGRLVTVPGAGHAVHHSHPEQLAALVRRFAEEPG